MPSAVHVFDIASLGPNDLWLIGSRNEINDPNKSIAVVWHSTDGGVNWTEAKTDGSNPIATASGFERHHRH